MRGGGGKPWRRWFAFLAVVFVLAGCTGGSDASDSSGRADPPEQDTREASDAEAQDEANEEAPDASAEEPPPPPVSESEAQDLVAWFASEIPVPDETLACVTAKLAEAPEAAAELRDVEPGGSVPDGVLDLAAACMAETRALPAFVEGVERAAEGLTDDQRACVFRGWVELDPAAVEAAQVEALGGDADEALAGEVGEMVRACGVETGR